MDSKKFKVGDRVRCIDASCWKNVLGEIGTVVAYENNDEYAELIVNFDNDVDGWGSEDLGIKDNHGLYMTDSTLELVDPCVH